MVCRVACTGDPNPTKTWRLHLLRQASVLVHPGHFYDFPSDGYLIVSLLTPPSEFREGTKRILEFLEPGIMRIVAATEN